RGKRGRGDAPAAQRRRSAPAEHADRIDHRTNRGREHRRRLRGRRDRLSHQTVQAGTCAQSRAGMAPASRSRRRGGPVRGLTAIVTGDEAGDVLARRLLPAAILVPAALGALWFFGQQAGLFEIGLALVLIMNVVVFATLIWITAAWLNRTDRRRK